MKKITLIALILMLPLFFACKSTPPEIESGLSPREYFQRAQEATDSSKYQTALAYYEAFLAAYPEDLERGLWAEYEIALLYEKMGKLEQSLKLFDALLARYDSPEAVTYPPGPRILAEKVKSRIEADLAK